jgi:hypothetical protein
MVVAHLGLNLAIGRLLFVGAFFDEVCLQSGVQVFERQSQVRVTLAQKGSILL